MTRLLPPSMSLRRLDENDWAPFAAIRLQALQECPSVYGSTFAREKVWTEESWRSLFHEPGVFLFGLFQDNALIAVQGLAADKKDPSLCVVWGSYIVPEQRGKGLFFALYEACIACARAQPSWKKITVSHRGDNAASKRVILGAGFVYTHTASRTWPDGATVEEPCYEIVL